MLRAHSTEQNVKCQVCDKKFSCYEYMKKHIREAHDTSNQVSIKLNEKQSKIVKTDLKMQIEEAFDRKVESNIAMKLENLKSTKKLKLEDFYEYNE